MSAITIHDKTNTYSVNVSTSGCAQVEDTNARQQVERIYLNMIEINNNMKELILLLSQRVSYSK